MDGQGSAFSLVPWRTERTGRGRYDPQLAHKEIVMNNIVYIVGAIVIVVAILSFVGLG